MKAVLAILIMSVSLQAQWMTGYYRGNNTDMPVSSIPWSKYTHIIHFAAAPALDTNGNFTGRLSLYYLDPAEITKLIASRPAGKKVLVSIKANDANFGAFAQCLDPAFISTFTQDIVDLVNKNGYDGVDIDWEHAVDIGRYSNLVSRLRTALPNKIITITSGDWEGLETVAATNYSLVDQINIMCYDMDGIGAGDCSGSDCTWHNAAVHQNGDVWKRACDLRVGRVTSKGVPNSKIGVGLPFYGRRHVGATQPQIIGNFYMDTPSYSALVNDPTRWQSNYMQYDSDHNAEYLSIPSFNEFISYNGVRSMKDYVSWMKTSGFGGMMTFTIEREFLSAATGDARYPLSTALNQALFTSGTLATPSITATPANSSGSSQLFSFQILGSTGSSAVTQFSLVVDSGLNRQNSCVVEYWTSSNTVFLKANNNQSWSNATIGAAGSLSNSQCSINTAASSFKNSVLNLSFTFNTSTFSGAKSLFTFASDNAGKLSGWLNSGSFTVR